MRYTPTIRHRRLAAELRRLRELSGLTQEDVCQKTGKDRSTLYRLEHAQQRPQRATLIQLLHLYCADSERTADLLALLRQSGQRGMFQPYRSVLPEVYADFMSFEHEADSICTYESLLIPGLLQTECYARAVITGGLPAASTGQVDHRVTARMERQEILSRTSPAQLWAIMDEAAIRRVVGDQQVMRDQLDRLREAAAMPNVIIQVIPFHAGAHPGMPGSFIVLDFADAPDQGLVYLDSMAGNLFLEDEAELRRFILMFQYLRAMALSPDQSTALIAEVAREV